MASPFSSSSSNPKAASSPVPVRASPSHRGPQQNPHAGPEEEPDFSTLLSPGGWNAHQCAERLFSEEDSVEEGRLGNIKEGGGGGEQEEEVEEEEEEGREVFEDVDELSSKGGGGKEEENDEFEDALESVSTPGRRKELSEKEDETPLTAKRWWRRGRRHFFILSEAGKPIYSLHGDEDQLASLMAVMQAMVSYVADMGGDSLTSMALSGGGRIVFSPRPPLVLVAVSWGAESDRQLVQQLTYLYNQLLSVLTLNQMTKIFEQRKGFDLRRMIAGSERLLASLCSAMDTDPSFFLSSVAVLPLQPNVRDSISNAIVTACSGGKGKKSSSAAPAPPVVFALLVAENQLVTLARMKKYLLHPADLHLVLNLVNSTESFKHSETWIPICLPKFDSSGFMHAHVSYLTETCKACLLLLTVERDAFFELAEAKKKVIESLEKTNCLSAMTDALSCGRETTASIGVPEIRHFLYKAKSASQFAYPAPSPPYDSAEGAARLRLHYLGLQEALHACARPLKLQWRAEPRESVLGWATQSFELYAAFSPLTTKSAAIDAVNRLLKWCKKEENAIFILNGPTF